MTCWHPVDAPPTDYDDDDAASPVLLPVPYSPNETGAVVAATTPAMEAN